MLIWINLLPIHFNSMQAHRPIGQWIPTYPNSIQTSPFESFASNVFHFHGNKGAHLNCWLPTYSIFMGTKGPIWQWPPMYLKSMQTMVPFESITSYAFWFHANKQAHLNQLIPIFLNSYVVLLNLHFCTALLFSPNKLAKIIFFPILYHVAYCSFAV